MRNKIKSGCHAVVLKSDASIALFGASVAIFADLLHFACGMAGKPFEVIPAFVTGSLMLALCLTLHALYKYYRIQYKRALKKAIRHRKEKLAVVIKAKTKRGLL